LNSQFLKARQTKYVAYAALYIAVTFSVVVVANILANRYEKTYDTTTNKRYSLSEQTIKVVKNLKQSATITYFDQPSRFSSAKDQLDLYANLNPKVHVLYVDPDKQPLVARDAGIKTYGTTVVEIGTNKNEAKSTTEEDITGAFIRDLKNTTRTVCFVSGSGEHQLDESGRDGFSRLKDLLGKDDYQTKSINLIEKSDVPSDCTVVVVGGPSRDYLQPEADGIKKYVEDGGRAMFLFDSPLKLKGMDIADNDALLAVLQGWGVTLDKDLVLDPLGQMAGVGAQLAVVVKYDSHPIVNEMKGTATGFPFSRSMETKNGDKTTVEKLFDSSQDSIAAINMVKPDPQDPKNKKGPFTIAAAGSYRTGKENSQGRFVVIGSSQWAANSFLPFNGNRDLALNALNWLSSDEDLISIRPKEPEDRRITMTDAQMRWVRITSQFLFPLAVVIAGFAVWWRRR